MAKNWKIFKDVLKVWLEKESCHGEVKFEIIEPDITLNTQINIKAICENKGKARMVFRKSKYESMKNLTDKDICSYISQVLKDHYRDTSHRKTFIPRKWLDRSNYGK